MELGLEKQREGPQGPQARGGQRPDCRSVLRVVALRAAAGHCQVQASVSFHSQ